MIGEFTNHLWQSTLFAIAVGLLTLAFRQNRARVRYWLWLSASLKFLVPFALLMSLGNQLRWTPPANSIATQIATPAFSYTMAEISQPFPDISFVPAAQQHVDWRVPVIFGLWFCGFAAIVVMRFRGWLRIRTVVRASEKLPIPAEVEIRSSHGLLEPGVVGLFRPVLLLPEGISERLTPSELEAVLAHELSHVRRHDNFFSALQMCVEAMFWFHPLAWWIGARLVEERELACDEDVLSLGNEPRTYADAIMRVCKLYVESPLACVSGVTGSDIRKRIEAIMANRTGQRLNYAKKSLLACAVAAAFLGPVIAGVLIGMGNLPAIHAQSPAVVSETAQQTTPMAARTVSPARKTSRKFEVTSVRPAADCSGGGGSRSGGKARITSSPLTLVEECQTVEDLIRWAYIANASGKPWPKDPVSGMPISPVPMRQISQEIKGSPAWLKSERYTIEAKASSPEIREMMRGPMMQRLLEDRFRLKIHRETIQTPVYLMKVAKNGPKLEPHKEGSCATLDFDHLPDPFVPGLRPCGAGRWPFSDYDGIDVDGITMGQLSRQLSANLDLEVLDKTGIAGAFDIHLSGSLPMPDDASPERQDSSDNLNSTTIVLQRLGLKLERGKSAAEVLVIDHIEKPDAN